MPKTSDTTRDIEIIAKQEALLQFTTFDHASAWVLGESIKKHCEGLNLAVTIEIRLCRETVFLYAMSGTSPNNADWARRKRNTTELQQRSSYAIGLELQDGETLATQSGLPLRDFAHHGGSVPIRLSGVGVVGAVTVSGLPQRQDHIVVVQTMASMIGVSLESCTLG